jgi:hypothetical protein
MLSQLITISGLISAILVAMAVMFANREDEADASKEVCSPRIEQPT